MKSWGLKGITYHTALNLINSKTKQNDENRINSRVLDNNVITRVIS